MTMKLLLKSGIVGLLLLTSSIASRAENYAQQLQLKNCGGYQIETWWVQRKKPGQTSWNSVLKIDQLVNNKEAMCFDLSQILDGNKQPVFTEGDQARLRVKIKGGSTVNCNGTNYKDGSQRRAMEMKGTTLNNNGCRTIGYKGLSNPCNGQNSSKIQVSC